MMPSPDVIPRSWFAANGENSDVAVSSRVRLARNLADFVFPRFLTQEDAERVHALVYDACTAKKGNSFRFTASAGIEQVMRSLLAERGIISPEDAADPRCGVILNDTGSVSCILNSGDHVRISSFLAGFDMSSCAKLAFELDETMQKRIQFAADGEFGYLTSSFKDVGSGLKASVILHLPALSITGMLDRVIRNLMSAGFAVSGFYNTKDGNTLGAFFQISTINSGTGSAEEQLSTFSDAVMRVISTERASLHELAVVKPTVLADMAYRAWAIAQNARFISLKESVEIISRLKLGVNAGILPIEHDRLYPLLYTVKNAYIQIRLSDPSDVLSQQIESDVSDDEQKNNRMRALLIQQAIAAGQG